MWQQNLIYQVNKNLPPYDTICQRKGPFVSFKVHHLFNLMGITKAIHD